MVNIYNTLCFYFSSSLPQTPNSSLQFDTGTKENAHWMKPDLGSLYADSAWKKGPAAHQVQASHRSPIHIPSM